ncbi:hypothetical protein BRUR0010001c01_00025 [Bifidobacterium phage BlindUri1]|nr:hypothetical protein BRUR0010001c01_00025 [Bifidobacterium phage BlindUri1]
MLKTVTRQLLVTYSMDKEKDLPENPGLVTMTVDTELDWPDSMRVALAYAASVTSIFESLEKFGLFQKDIEQYPNLDIVSFISRWDRYLDKKADDWAILKFISASPKPVVKRPPFSRCPRCEARIWPGSLKRLSIGPDHLPEENSDWLERAKAEYQENPEPHYCLHCGQRFRYSDGLDYKASSSIKEIVSELGTMAKASQPTFEDIAY